MIALDFGIVIAYFLGGFTFVPAFLAIILLHAHLTFPTKKLSEADDTDAADDIRQPNDDTKSLLSGDSAGNLLEKFRGNYEPEVAAGYFAVCREYVPGGVNGKPPERTTPVGTVVATESPSVYQSMYRSIFDRKQIPTLDTRKADGRPVKRASNVFFVILRHGHLMLYEDSGQVEVKHVLSLERHVVSIYGGGEPIPEGELWIKRNAIRLLRKGQEHEGIAKPFFLFSENSSDKEDFYFALLRNQERHEDLHDNPPGPLQYDPKHIIGLVQRLHSSEEQLETRWINGLIGRLFLALYKTAHIEDFVRQKISKKIARVKKPAFLSDIVLRKIDFGDSAPQITNPKLKDLMIHGDCCAEADFRYDGNFRLEVAATARLDLGARFKAREVNLVLAVVVKKLNGHGLMKFKPPPSNRIWIAFERMPDIDLVIEPIVSSRQITYGVILRAIQSRIREVIAETLVQPHWDDIPFTDTIEQDFRGGIWVDQQASNISPADQVKIPDEALDDGVEPEVDRVEIDTLNLAKLEETPSIPAFPSSGDSAIPKHEDAPNKMSEEKHGPSQALPSKTEKAPKVLRSTSFASAADPLLTNASADFVQRGRMKSKKRQKDATTSMKAITGRSKPASPNETSPPVMEDPQSAPASPNTGDPASPQMLKPIQDNGSVSGYSMPDSRDSGTTSRAASQASLGSNGFQSTKSTPETVMKGHGSEATGKEGKKSTAALGAATAAAKKWAWGVLSRHPNQQGDSPSPDLARAGTPENPIGRGQPLPPPGQPLPSPNAPRVMSMPVSSPKRKPLPSPLLPQRPKEQDKGRSSPLPALPAGRRHSSMAMESTDTEGLLVVQAPTSEPPSPTSAESKLEAKEQAAGAGLGS